MSKEKGIEGKVNATPWSEMIKARAIVEEVIRKENLAVEKGHSTLLGQRNFVDSYIEIDEEQLTNLTMRLERKYGIHIPSGDAPDVFGEWDDTEWASDEGLRKVYVADLEKYVADKMYAGKAA